MGKSSSVWRRADTWFIVGVAAMAGSVLVVAAALVVLLSIQAAPAFQAFGLGFFVSRMWDPVDNEFGALPFLYGTLVTSFLALFMVIFVGIGSAVFLTQYVKGWIASVTGFLIELLAAIPSVVYGLWGIFVVAPWLRSRVEPWLAEHFGFLPLFQGPQLGVGLLAASFILAIMILPTVASLSRDVMAVVPAPLKEGALALGATHWEMIRTIVLPYSWPGVIGALMLGLGRALGETMAVTMVIGNRPDISVSLFAPGHSMASVIANEFTEATSEVHIAALSEIGLVLFLVTALFSLLSRWMVVRLMARAGREE
ncbi:MAG: phosphate ABC transporter permease subunit PstC [Alicyclobacillaceae bacterium]|nr:phosphate ABC transporter permease subunit PstC [Alicyclobacillaceae bacterium]